MKAIGVHGAAQASGRLGDVVHVPSRTGQVIRQYRHGKNPSHRTHQTAQRALHFASVSWQSLSGAVRQTYQDAEARRFTWPLSPSSFSIAPALYATAVVHRRMHGLETRPGRLTVPETYPVAELTPGWLGFTFFARWTFNPPPDPTDNDIVRLSLVGPTNPARKPDWTHKRFCCWARVADEYIEFNAAVPGTYHFLVQVSNRQWPVLGSSYVFKVTLG